MRLVLATALSLLLAGPAFAQQWQSSQSQPTQHQFGIPENQSSMNDQNYQNSQQFGQAQNGNDVLLLVPTRDMTQFRQALPQNVSQDLQPQQAQPFQFNGEQFRLVAVPASDLRQIDQATSGKPLHNDVKVVLGFGDFLNVANLRAFESNMQANGSAWNGQPNTSSMQQPIGGSAPGATAGTSNTATVQQIQPTSNGKILTLQDGRTLFLPDSVNVAGGSLQPGATVSGRYMQQNGQDIVTAMRVR